MGPYTAASWLLRLTRSDKQWVFLRHRRLWTNSFVNGHHQAEEGKENARGWFNSGRSAADDAAYRGRRHADRAGDKAEYYADRAGDKAEHYAVSICLFVCKLTQLEGHHTHVLQLGVPLCQLYLTLLLRGYLL